jgi:hypothetical protein
VSKIVKKDNRVFPHYILKEYLYLEEELLIQRGLTLQLLHILRASGLIDELQLREVDKERLAQNHLIIKAFTE